MEARSDVRGAVDEREPLIIRRVDAIPVGLPLQKAVAMAGATVSRALNIWCASRRRTAPSAGAKPPPPRP